MEGGRKMKRAMRATGAARYANEQKVARKADITMKDANRSRDFMNQCFFDITI